LALAALLRRTASAGHVGGGEKTVPVHWRSRLARLWWVLTAAWAALWFAIAIGSADHYGFWRWFFDPLGPGWTWLFGPPLGLAVVLQLGGWLAWGAVRSAGASRSTDRPAPR
jgi:hypothetical protein